MLSKTDLESLQNPFTSDISSMDTNSQFSFPSPHELFKKFGFEHEFPSFDKDSFKVLGLSVNTMPTHDGVPQETFATSVFSTSKESKTEPITYSNSKTDKTEPFTTESTAYSSGKTDKTESSTIKSNTEATQSSKNKSKCVCGRAKKPDLKESKLEALKFRKQLHLYKKNEKEDEKVRN